MPEILKVTDPDKVVTDLVLLSSLEKQGIDKDYVEFFQDYAPRNLGKEHSPYAKFYQDLKSNKRFMVVSGLPMVDADGVKIEAGWRQAGINYFTEKNNLFWGKVQGTNVELTIKNDQPDSRKANDRLSYNPQLFLNDIEQSCHQSALLAVDPTNPNYLENTLEWDYGICKRRLRIIEGGIYGSWVFPSKPTGEIRIKYNQTGDYKLRLGQFKVSDDEEVIKPEDFDKIAAFWGKGYPVTISDSATFYPDPHPESTSVDGRASRQVAAESWASIRGGAGTEAADDIDALHPVGFESGSGSGTWVGHYRIFTLYDISSLPPTAIISAVTKSLYGRSKSDGLGIACSLNIYSGIPASNTAIVAADYAIANFGTTAFCDTPITYANWLLGDGGDPETYRNDWIFNATGIAAAQTATDGAGILKLSARNNYDVTGNTPAWKYSTSYTSAYASEKGTGYKPKVVITYTAITDITITLTTTMDSIGVYTSPTTIILAQLVTLMEALSEFVEPSLTIIIYSGMAKLRDGFKFVHRKYTKL